MVREFAERSDLPTIPQQNGMLYETDIYGIACYESLTHTKETQNVKRNIEHNHAL